MKRWIIPLLLLALFSVGVAYWYVYFRPYSGYERGPDRVYRKLIAFGDCGGALAGASHAAFDFALGRPEGSDTLYHYSALTGAISQSESGAGTHRVNDALMRYLLDMKCGDHVNFLLPYGHIAGTWLEDQERTKAYAEDEEVLLSVRLNSVFDRASFAEFMSGLTRDGEVDEVTAIQSVLVNEAPERVKAFGDICLEFLSVSPSGDSVRAGVPVSISYSTHLLDGTAVDELSAMQFEFGRPGQLVDGLQFGLSKMKDGDRARIFVPSYLAFGEAGSSTGLIPPRTPLYFEVAVTLGSE